MKRLAQPRLDSRHGSRQRVIAQGAQEETKLRAPRGRGHPLHGRSRFRRPQHGLTPAHGTSHRVGEQDRPLPAACHPTGVPEQNHLEKHRWVVGKSSGLIVVVSMFEDRQIDLIVHQVADRVLNRPQHNLILTVNRHHHPSRPTAILVACIDASRCNKSSTLLVLRRR